MDRGLISRWLILIIALSVLFTVKGIEIAVRRNESAILPCDTGRILKDTINVVRWLYREREAEQERRLLEWKQSQDTPIFSVSSPERYTFHNTTFQLDILNTELADTGLYICRTFVVANRTDEATTRDLVFEDNHDLIVQDIPSAPPEKPTIIVLSDVAIRIEWIRSEHENNSPISAYLVLLKTNQMPTWTNAMSYYVPGNVNTTTKRDLWPYTEYQVRIVASNEVGKSEPSEPSDIYRTMQGTPTGKPRFEKEQNYTTAIYIEFTPPPGPTIKGILEGYELAYREHETENPVSMANLDANATSYNITGLKPYTVYVISLRIINGAEIFKKGPEEMRAIWTDEGVPSAPRIMNLRNRTDKFIQLEWEKPTPTNGVIVGYIIYWSHGRFNYSKRHDKAHSDIMTYTLRQLEPYTEYKLRVSARTRKGEGPQSAAHPGLTDVSGPSEPEILNATTNSTSNLLLKWQHPKTYYRRVSRYILYLDNLNTGEVIKVPVPCNDAETQEELVTGLEPGMTYDIRIAGETKSMFSDHYYPGPLSDPVTKKLDKLPTTMPPGENGDGSDGSIAISKLAGVLAGVICTFLILLVAVLLLIFVKRFMKTQYSYVGDPDSAPPANGPDGVMLPDAYGESSLVKEDIPVHKWREHVIRCHADGDLIFSQEYDDINQATRMDLTVNHSTDPDNKHKNRYVNIQAYDHSRVILKKKGDYINANYIDGYHQPRAYIAAQGPLPSTFADFWQMVWEQNSSVIVMITNLMERGRRKCDQYWPQEGEQTYGAVTVRLTDTLVTSHYTVRVFSVRQGRDRHSVVKKKLIGAGERTVYQYHYTDWPDHGVPLFTLPVLQFVRKSVAANKEDSGPPIVHCSAGVGRTGTYIVIDSMMRQIADKASLNAFSFLMHIRNQRNYLVQTEDQYIFLHDTLLEHLEAGVTERRDGEIAGYLEALQRPVEQPGAGGDASMTLLERQFKLLTEFKPQEYHMNAACMPYNKDKNRFDAILPVDKLRVRLPAKPGVPGSDYINASYIQGYNKHLEYIVTQHPLSNTIEDFWRMVWDKNSLTIVLLSTPDDGDYPQFWPALQETVEYGHFKVTFIEEATPLNFVTRDFLLQSTQDDYECTVRLISTSYWPETCEPLSTAFELVHTVNSWDQQQEQQIEGPAIVVDKYGGREAATFCALSTLYDQLHKESTVDVYLVCKLYHLKRPGMFASVADYHFLYKAIESIATADDPSSPVGDKDSGISNCNSYPPPATPAPGVPPSSPGGPLVLPVAVEDGGEEDNNHHEGEGVHNKALGRNVNNDDGEDGPALPLTPMITRSVSEMSNNGGSTSNGKASAETTM